jgi:hypothetical protein
MTGDFIREPTMNGAHAALQTISIPRAILCGEDAANFVRVTRKRSGGATLRDHRTRNECLHFVSPLRRPYWF